MDLGYVTVGMVLTLLVLFIAEGICNFKSTPRRMNY